jgi:plasmid stabilization system protein ParE
MSKPRRFSRKWRVTSAKRRIEWSLEALDDLRELRAWLKTLPRANPGQTFGRIRAEVNALSTLGDIGRPGRRPGLCERALRNVPYVLIYAATAGGFRILAVLHMAQDRS